MIEATVIAALIGGIAGVGAGFVTSLLANQQARERLNAEFKTERAVEMALQHFLSLHEVPFRSYPMIRHYMGGFESNELRRLLVRAGAIRFIAADGTEMWALLDRVEEDFKAGSWKLQQAPRRPPDDALFPGAFSDKSNL